MKISVNWLKEYTKVDLSIDELATKIGAQLGAVEEIIDLNAKYSGIVIAKVVNCEDHPDADKLHVCMIDDGGFDKNVPRDSDNLVQVVCGANNVAAGQTIVWIPPGVIVPETFGKPEPFKLTAKELRGVLSQGMIASARELDFGDEHSGIVVLDQEVKPGTPITKVFCLNDYIIDIENKMFTHRPDCFGILGVAREVAGIQCQQFTSPDWYLNSSSELADRDSDELELIVENQVPELAPRFMAVAIKGATVKPSPLWLQTLLSRLGVKPINNVVDVTNFIMVLTAQPLHAYDYDKVAKANSDGKARIVVRRAKENENVTLLGEKQIKLTDKVDSAIIATDKMAIGVGGIMGGADTEVDDSTKNIILECANFNLYAIRKTAFAYGLFTDAFTRFSKNQSKWQNPAVIAKAISMILEQAGGQVASLVLDEPKPEWQQTVVKVDAKFINDRLGSKLSTQEIVQILINVEFGVEVSGEELAVKVPFWRTDIEIAEDIVEEVGRLYGYDKLPLVLPIRSITPAKTNGLLETKKSIRNILKSAGANEVLGYSFVHGNLLDKVGQDKSLAYQLNNAISPDLQYYRMSLLPSLLEKIHPNIKAGYPEFAIFEIGKTHIKGWLDEEKLPKEEERLGLVFAVDDKLAKNYQGAAFYQAKKYLSELLSRLGVEVIFSPMPDKAELDINAQMVAMLAKERSAILIEKSSGDLLGVMGEFKQKVQKSLKLPAFTAGFEVSTQMLIPNGKSNYKPISRYPKVEQDMTLKVKSSVTYKEIYNYLDEELNKQKQQDCTYKLDALDIYQPDAETKNYSFRLTVASYNKTLKSAEVNELLDKLAQQVNKQLDAVRI